MRILLIEDNRELSDWLSRLLRKSRYVVDAVHDGADADTALATQLYDLIILDLGLPGMAGLQVLKRFRQKSGLTPVIILTASDAVSNRVAGLDAGADDYLVKPFDPLELEARIRAQLRRRQDNRTSQVVFGPLVLETGERRFSLDGSPLDLTAREYSVLEALVLASGRVVSKAALTETVFGFNDEVTDNALEIYVHRVRKKLGTGKVTIGTLRGLGYALRKSCG
ncbi:MAG: response regulator transcription factor [Bosea sp.]|uniref:response regulator transcription factor n=1 Tax=unclassified Bosea (in: a-proteobacteria) TaxID=2653178 RepID=UPI0009644731|nr:MULTISPECIES: response regulator transcription factor [unclassified Bosea (in: a-proteobacteria)]MBN9459330.1 response regulator transcription factor [Bosea sp. (in: a-proteobacteria)]OJV05476.1 MAG: DNA-binding response regulator [Bosea sp. 67-29]